MSKQAGKVPEFETKADLTKYLADLIDQYDNNPDPDAGRTRLELQLLELIVEVGFRARKKERAHWKMEVREALEKAGVI